MIPSYHDLNNENSYHMMMLGMCLCLSDNYKVIYNREEGKGRCDLIIQAHDEKKTSFIIEFKYFKEDKKDFEKALDKLSNEAIQQIKDRRFKRKSDLYRLSPSWKRCHDEMGRKGLYLMFVIIR